MLKLLNHYSLFLLGTGYLNINRIVEKLACNQRRVDIVIISYLAKMHHPPQHCWYWRGEILIHH